MDKRFHQAHKEALWAVALTVLYLLGWVITAYLSDNGIGIMGLPHWFELSCILLPVVFIMLCWGMVKFLFRNIPLDGPENE